MVSATPTLQCRQQVGAAVPWGNEPAVLSAGDPSPRPPHSLSPLLSEVEALKRSYVDLPSLPGFASSAFGQKLRFMGNSITCEPEGRRALLKFSSEK